MGNKCAHHCMIRLGNKNNNKLDTTEYCCVGCRGQSKESQKILQVLQYKLDNSENQNVEKILRIGSINES